jgi:hypothetical protein
MPLFLSDSDFCTALEVDDVDCLRLVISRGAIVVGRGVYARSKACLEYLLDHCPCYEPDFDVYVKHNLIEQVRILIARGYTWTSRTLAACVAKGLLPMLKFLHEQGCSEWAGVTTAACNEERFDILQYAHEHGAPWDANTTLGGECSRARVSLARLNPLLAGTAGALEEVQICTGAQLPVSRVRGNGGGWWLPAHTAVLASAGLRLGPAGMHAERTGCRKAGRGPLFAYGGCGAAPGRFADNCLSRGPSTPNICP